ISGATVYADNGVFTTDSDGMIHLTFNSPGRVSMSTVKAGYSISSSELTVNAAGLFCGYPAFFGFLLFSAASLPLLWVLSLAFASANFLLFGRRLLQQKRPDNSTILKIIYSFGPLMIALAPGTVYGICFVSNVVTLQFIIELLILALGALQGKSKSVDIKKLNA